MYQETISGPQNIHATAAIAMYGPYGIAVYPPSRALPRRIIAQPTTEPKELPHTGGLEGWNIPSLLIMLAGLLLVIIGVRRLRTKE